MEFTNYILTQVLILVPTLLILGKIIKDFTPAENKFIPVILLIFGIVGSIAMLGFNVDAVIQGILVTGLAVYGNQLYQQLLKKEE